MPRKSTAPAALTAAAAALAAAAAPVVEAAAAPVVEAAATVKPSRSRSEAAAAPVVKAQAPSAPSRSDKRAAAAAAKVEAEAQRLATLERKRAEGAAKVEAFILAAQESLNIDERLSLKASDIFGGFAYLGLAIIPEKQKAASLKASLLNCSPDKLASLDLTSPEAAEAAAIVRGMVTAWEGFAAKAASATNEQLAKYGKRMLAKMQASFNQASLRSREAELKAEAEANKARSKAQREAAAAEAAKLAAAYLEAAKPEAAEAAPVAHAVVTLIEAVKAEAAKLGASEAVYILSLANEGIFQALKLARVAAAKVEAEAAKA